MRPPVVGNFRRRPRVRTVIFACLFALGFMGYVERTTVAIAAERMMPELGLTQIQYGWLINAFMICYMAFQVPGAVLGQRWGARRAIAAIGFITAAAAAATALAPPGRASWMVLALVFLTRSILGAAQAPLFPVTSGVIESWYPVKRWALMQGLLVTGIWLGAAATPPVVAWLMNEFSWRVALVATSVPAVLIAAFWARYARNRPAEHPSVQAEELAQLRDNPPAVDAHLSWKQIATLLCDRRIALVTLSYLLMNYVFYLVSFWCFLYLVQERHFARLEGGGLASLPFLAAAVAAAVGGRICDRLCERYGTRVGLRAVPMLALPTATVFLVLTGAVASAYLAVVVLCLAFFFTELTEGPYWAATMRMAPTEVMAATGILNTGGNLGGVIATPTIAALSSGRHWMAVFSLGAVLMIAAAILWAFIDAKEMRRISPTAEIRASA
jgi:ACS family glucarate transporter-like MFS transporter